MAKVFLVKLLMIGFYTLFAALPAQVVQVAEAKSESVDYQMLGVYTLLKVYWHRPACL